MTNYLPILSTYLIYLSSRQIHFFNHGMHHSHGTASDRTFSLTSLREKKYHVWSFSNDHAFKIATGHCSPWDDRLFANAKEIKLGESESRPEF